jgi:anaerobic ribonucleoside-triphosphate reductase
MVLVQKRNGTKVPFDIQKIIDAINKAFIEIDG